MKRIVVSLVGVLVASIVVISAPASSQTGTTTTIDPLATTTIDPLATTTIDPLATTTIDPSATTTTVAPPLPGEHITDGALTLGAQLHKKTASGCQIQGSLAGQEMNLVRNEGGMIGGVYGKAVMGADTAGMVMIQLGPLPTGVLAYRSTGNCNQDVVAVGGFSAGTSNVHFEGIGYAAYPGDFAPYVTATVDVATSGGTPTLDLQSASNFLTTPRPTK